MGHGSPPRGTVSARKRALRSVQRSSTDAATTAQVHAARTSGKAVAIARRLARVGLDQCPCPAQPSGPPRPSVPIAFLFHMIFKTAPLFSLRQYLWIRATLLSLCSSVTQNSSCVLQMESSRANVALWPRPHRFASRRPQTASAHSSSHAVRVACSGADPVRRRAITGLSGDC